MLFVITVLTKLKVEKTSIVENEFTLVVNVIELLNIKMMIDKSANTAKSIVVKFLNILIQFFELEIVR